ncbi:MAG: phasin family protein [Myxococcota bacterium]
MLKVEKNDGTKERRQATDLFERVWSQALTAVSTAEDEASKVVARLGEVAGWSQEEAKRHVRELSERLAAQRKDLERNLEEGVKRALQALRLPRREEVSQLNARLDQLARRIDALSGAKD